MWLNILGGIVLPWVVIIYLYFKNNKLTVSIYLLDFYLAVIVNNFGMHFRLWDIYPYNKPFISKLMPQLGLYPMLGILMIYIIHDFKFNSIVVILSFTIVTTILEGVAELIGWVAYHNGWNIGLTFLSYLIPYIILTFLYKWFCRIDLINKSQKGN